MAKNIIICADGTGNTTVKGRGSNVFKLYEAVDQHGHRSEEGKNQQVAIYHDGVGTEKLKWPRLVGGVFGWGLSRNVKQLYGELARVYDPGDDIYLFGFSRGAFTVRTLAGLIVTCGVLDPSRYKSNRAFWKAVRQAYREYRRKYQTTLSRLLRGKVEVSDDSLRRRFSVAIPAFSDESKTIIRFIGVWDTVDAVGSPLGIANVINGALYRFKFPDRTLSERVAHACHALALDEQRESFEPLLWCEGPNDATRIEQVWFAGVHSNVGGGYPRQGMSLVALDWMMRRAEAHGVRFLDMPRALFRAGSDVDDKLYDPRAGFGVFYRWRPRNVVALCRKNNIRPKIHGTVFQRLARNTDGYAPGSIPPEADVVDANPGTITEPMKMLVAAHHDGGPALLEREARAHVFGTTAYWLMLLSTLTLAALILYRYYLDVGADLGWRERAVAFASTVISSNWLGLIARTAWNHPWVPGGAVAALLLSLLVDRHLDARYSEFWHRSRGPLRDLLDGTPR